MPLTDFQKKLVILLAANREPSSHLAGGAALHFEQNSLRYSNDLDYFHDSPEQVKIAFEKDNETLKKASYEVNKTRELNGFIRCDIIKNGERTKIEWVHDSAWRFLPAIANSECGFQLHPIDIALNKLLALAGRNEARDFIDILYINKKILSLGALCWAAVSKDPGFSPTSLLELVQRRGSYREEEFVPLMYKEKIDLKVLKLQWLEALELARAFIPERDPKNVGCLYYSKQTKEFISPTTADKNLDSSIIVHSASTGGSLP